MNFNIGDKVRFLNDIGNGVVIAHISNLKVKVLCSDGFERFYQVKELVKLSVDEIYSFNPEGIANKIKADTKKKAASKLTDETSYKGTDFSFREIDLHIEHLVDYHRELNNAEILSVQMSVFIREVNSALRNRVKRMVVIHGVGEGVLKAEILKELHYNFPEIRYYDADVRKYGNGATELILAGL